MKTASSVYSDGTVPPEFSMERVFTTAYSAFIHSSYDFGIVQRTRGVHWKGAGMISCNATELKASFIGCTRTHRLHGTRLTSSRQVYVDFLVKSEWSSELMNEL